MYVKLYASPHQDYEIEYDYTLCRKIYESYAIFAALYPTVALETILKQGILRRAAGESVVFEKK